jgi:hypothetical protein
MTKAFNAEVKCHEQNKFVSTDYWIIEKQYYICVNNYASALKSLQAALSVQYDCLISTNKQSWELIKGILSTYTSQLSIIYGKIDANEAMVNKINTTSFEKLVKVDGSLQCIVQDDKINKLVSLLYTHYKERLSTHKHKWMI